MDIVDENNDFIEDTKKVIDGPEDGGYFDEDDFNSVADKTGDFWDGNSFYIVMAVIRTTY